MTRHGILWALIVTTLFGESCMRNPDPVKPPEPLTPSRALAQWRNPELSGDVDSLKGLLEACPDLVNNADSSGTLLHYVARQNQEEVVEMLVSAGADIKALDSDGYSPLHSAAYFDSADAASVLLKHGAPVDRVKPYPKELQGVPGVKNGISALDIAAQNGCHRTAKVLLEAGAKLDVNPPEHSFPAIFHAVSGRYPIEKRFRLKRRPDHSRYDELITPPEPGNALVIDLLVEYGADLNGTLFDLTPLEYAVDCNAADTVRHLLKKYSGHFKLNENNNRGQPILFQAIMRRPRGRFSPDPSPDDTTRYNEIIQVLVEYGSDPNPLDGRLLSGTPFVNAYDCAASWGASEKTLSVINSKMKLIEQQ